MYGHWIGFHDGGAWDVDYDEYLGKEDPSGIQALSEAMTKVPDGTTLHTLNLSSNNIYPEGAAAIAKVLKTKKLSLDTLDLSDDSLCGVDWMDRDTFSFSFKLLEGSYDNSGLTALFTEALSLPNGSSLRILNLAGE
eukprot:1196114-Prorocentrum_minimum.AAC.4